MKPNALIAIKAEIHIGLNTQNQDQAIVSVSLSVIKIKVNTLIKPKPPDWLFCLATVVLLCLKFIIPSSFNLDANYTRLFWVVNI